MKLQNMTVIFIIIMIPIIIVTSYYIGLQIKTITMQKDYTVKLQTAAKDSIQALEINTVEWNSASSNLADSKRRDVLASINTFTTSLANNMGIGGAGKGRIQTYIPAIVYTMYDGYYIYSASLMKDQDTTSEGLTQFNDDGTIKSNGTSYQYILKPYSPYSARYVSGNTDITVNYTLDNYIRVYGTVNGEYQAKEGYLVVCDDNAGVKNVESGRISEITYRGATIKPETLTEQVYTVDDGKVKKYSYIYDQYDNKLYWDKDADPNKDGTNEGNYFSVDKNNKKVYLQTALPEGDAGFSITNRFRKISIPMESKGELTVQKVFQILNPGGGYKFYYENQSGAFIEFTNPEKTLGTVKQEEDYSAINYCVESYVFTQWVTKELGRITVGDMKSPTVGQYNNVKSTETIFDINSSNNNPDPENDGAYATSVLAQHKKDIIINTIEKNLSQATEQAKKMNPNYEYRLPQLSYDEWEQALSNISIIAFMQGMPIGLKYYNNYAIATSTLNKEFVDPDELYFAGTDDQYYHQRQCDQATGSNYIGYRSIDYVAKSYEVENDTTKYYYPHANGGNSELECYYCLVNRSTYNKAEKNAKWNNNQYSSWTDSYYNALARERYMQLDEPGTYKPNVTITKTASSGSVEYGGTITYTITITNNGIVEDKINFLDFWDKNDFGENIEVLTNTLSSDYPVPNTVIYEKNPNGTNKLDQNGNPIAKNGIYVGDITIKSGETKTLEYKINAKGNLGKDLVNIAAIYSYGNNDVSIAEAKATTTVKKTIKVAKTEVAQNYNIVLILDHSNSLNNDTMKSVYAGVSNLLGGEEYILGKLFPEGKESKSQISTIHFYGISNLMYGIKSDGDNTCLNSREKIKDALTDTYNSVTIFDTKGGTNYSAALEKALTQFEKMNTGNKNILVFFTDGAPTDPNAGKMGGIGYTINVNKKGNYYYNKYTKAGYLGTEEGGLGEKIWLNGNNSKLSINNYRGIQQIVKDIKAMNTDIYCINYGDEDSKYGLRNMISSYTDEHKEYYAFAEETTEIKQAFKNIGKSILNPDIGEINYSPATSNKIELEKPEKITYIQVGNIKYEKGTEVYNSIIEVENGKTYLNLEMVDLNQEITIIY